MGRTARRHPRGFPESTFDVENFSLIVAGARHFNPDLIFENFFPARGRIAGGPFRFGGAAKRPQHRPPRALGPFLWGLVIQDLLEWCPLRAAWKFDEAVLEVERHGISVDGVNQDGSCAETAKRFFQQSGSKALPMGEIEWMRNKVGRETNVRLLVEVQMGPKEIGKLIKLPEAQKAVLEDDDDDEEAAN
ncbi:hypothetical protein [Bradyrhizobium sp. B120]|uniref:hypothetical protein n=1 Tax=Bradyrhizobium sp. B120 TaxID=3410088 RepID=UPI003B987FC3